MQECPLIFCCYGAVNKVLSKSALTAITRQKVFHKGKIANLGRQEPQPAGATKWATLRFGEILNNFSCKKYTESDVRFMIQAMVSHKLFPYFEALEPIIREI